MGYAFLVIGFLAFFVGIIYLIVNLFRKKSKRTPLIVIVSSIVLFIAGAIIAPKVEEDTAKNPNESSKVAKVDAKIQKVDKDKLKKDAEEKAKKEEEKKLKEILNFQGKLNSEVKNGKVVISIDSNVPDGGVFEVALMNGKFNAKSDFLKIKDGKINKEFSIPKDWGVGYIATTAMFRFNYEKHPQPKTIKDIYGNKGENLSGELVTKNKTGNSAVLKTKTVPFPNKKAIQTEQNKAFNKTKDSLIKASSGIIIGIEPRYDNKWDLVNVFVSDSWYYSADYEKERFAEQVGETVQNLVINAGKAKDPVMVYFVDSFNKDVATPKMFGGWKIKK